MIFNLLRRNRIDPSPLLSSQLFNDQMFYTSFLNDIKGSRKEVFVESPFITKRRMSELFPAFESALRRGVRLTINTRDPKTHEPRMRFDAHNAVALLQEMGACVLYTDNHHRKLAIIDGHILWEGSLNILSQNASCEVMRRIESNDLAGQMYKFIRLKM